jgi:hypothetical protein
MFIDAIISAGRPAFALMRTPKLTHAHEEFVRRASRGRTTETAKGPRPLIVANEIELPRENRDA